MCIESNLIIFQLFFEKTFKKFTMLNDTSKELSDLNYLNDYLNNFNYLCVQIIL